MKVEQKLIDVLEKPITRQEQGLELGIHWAAVSQRAIATGYRRRYRRTNLTDEEILGIQQRFFNGESVRDIADTFNIVNVNTIYKNAYKQIAK